MADREDSFSEYLTDGDVLSPKEQLREEIEVAISQSKRLSDLVRLKLWTRNAAVIMILMLIWILLMIVWGLPRQSISPQIQQILPAAGILVLFGVYQGFVWFLEEDRQLRRLHGLIDRLDSAIFEAKSAVTDSG
jgi:hypothetical protein